MARSYTIASGQKNFPKLVARSEASDPIPIERHGHTVAYVISKKRFDTVLETLELLANPEFVATLAAHRQGKLRFRPLRGGRA